MRQYVLILDLKDDPILIKEYIEYHQNVWPEIEESLKESGILTLKIFRFKNHLTMLLEVSDSFSFEKKAALDLNNPKVQEWENLMWKYQSPVSGAPQGEKWVLMEEIYQLNTN